MQPGEQRALNVGGCSTGAGVVKVFADGLSISCLQDFDQSKDFYCIRKSVLGNVADYVLSHSAIPGFVAADHVARMPRVGHDGLGTSGEQGPRIFHASARRFASCSASLRRDAGAWITEKSEKNGGRCRD
jgi:hypothetical protein